jgi:hypothetical protein
MVTAWGRRRLVQAGVLHVLEQFLATRPAHAFPPQHADLWFLYRMVRRRRPAVIWEFGSGNSTPVLAQALIDNGGGHLYSMESDASWAAATSSALPASLRAVCAVLYAPQEAITYHGVAACRHRGLPERPPNFAYLDSGWAPTVDLLLIEDLLPADFYLIIDDRQADTAFLREHFIRPYRFIRRRWVRQQVFELVPQSVLK